MSTIVETSQRPRILHEADVIDAHLGMRLFLITEILLLAGLFLLYSVYHSRFPEDFLFCTGTLDLAAGTIGAIVLLSGGIAMFTAVAAIKKNNRRRAAFFLSAVLFSGIAFLISRVVEWSSLFKLGLFPNSKILLQHPPGENTFYSLYFLATGLHALYTAAAIAVLSVMLFKVSRKTTEITSETETGRPAPRAENSSLFWYLLCGIWFFLLPLFYFADIPAKYLPLLPYGIFFMLLLHLPYAALLLGYTALSTVYRKWKPELSMAIINLTPVKLPAWIAFGFLPPLALALLYKLLFSNTAFPITLFLLRIMMLNILGFFLLVIYRRTGHVIAGAAGVLSMGLYCFYFIDITSLTVFPEKWSFLKPPLPYPLFSITPLIDFIDFLCLSFIITGAAILFFYFQWPGKGPRLGTGLVLTGALAMPLVILWDLFTLPGYALSVPVFVLAGAMITVLAFTGYAAVSLLRRKDGGVNLFPRYGAAIVTASLLLFGLWIAKDRTLQVNSNLETAAVLTGDAVKTQADFVSKREALYAQSMVIDEKLGERVYFEKCSACHDFDRKILGPPLNNVLPKYLDRQDDLAAFLKDPKKIDPRYPAMANPGLTTVQIKSVVKFLMLKMGVKGESASN